ncbi:MAG: hypothetical protein ACYCQK_01525 [Acidiferrobacteraceae bacterium]
MQNHAENEGETGATGVGPIPPRRPAGAARPRRRRYKPRWSSLVYRASATHRVLGVRVPGDQHGLCLHALSILRGVEPGLTLTAWARRLLLRECIRVLREAGVDAAASAEAAPTQPTD